MKGKVYLMGAGPGDPDLLTVKAMRVLRASEVVLHDDLVAAEILELIPAWTQVLNVGRRCGQAGMPQEKIHSLLISAAREGHQVVRLKGGDPLLFGRVGEEMEALSRRKRRYPCCLYARNKLRRDRSQIKRRRTRWPHALSHRCQRNPRGAADPPNHTARIAAGAAPAGSYAAHRRKGRSALAAF